MLSERELECPCCGGRFIALIDTSEGSCEYIQDCEICCRPLRFVIVGDPFAEDFDLQVLREDET